MNDWTRGNARGAEFRREWHGNELIAVVDRRRIPRPVVTRAGHVPHLEQMVRRVEIFAIVVLQIESVTRNERTTIPGTRHYLVARAERLDLELGIAFTLADLGVFSRIVVVLTRLASRNGRFEIERRLE